ncbi:MarR family winged helix-turn-helix transcriptional regulator [Dactylosporangium sp. CA-139066]|uniref:MarR family winged helix-turn-helix transcriptional regulator n=1 Tax=Dactylosporangium sp. CA-139066 TaxID=3239930 RepID=UPI003D8D1858
MAIPTVHNRLGYLLKHAQLRLHGLTGRALEPYGIDGRQLAVLLAIDDRVPQSQQEVARRLDVDRTSMVALVDELERKGLAERRPVQGDRRKNVVALTAAGRDTVRKATEASDAAERDFLAGLSEAEAATFRRLLQTVVS